MFSHWAKNFIFYYKCSLNTGFFIIGFYKQWENLQEAHTRFLSFSYNLLTIIKFTEQSFHHRHPEKNIISLPSQNYFSPNYSTNTSIN